MDWISKAINFVTAKSQNELFDYLKHIVYETNDTKLIQKKDLALDYLFNGLAYSDQKKFDKAVHFIQSAIDIYEESKDDLRKAFGLFFMGIVYKDKEQKETALNYFQEAEKIFIHKDNKMQHACENKIKEMEL